MENKEDWKYYGVNKKPSSFTPVTKKEKLSKIPSFRTDVESVFNELQVLLLKKHEDYGPKNISESPGGALNGLRVRMHDKLARINNLIDNKKTPKNEALEDSFIDMANYAVIGLLVLRGKWDKKYEGFDSKLQSMKELWDRDNL
jgi:hypothetical protein